MSNVNCENHPDDSNKKEVLNQDKLENEGGKNRGRNFSIWHVLKNITIEPSMLLYEISFMLWIFASQNLSLEKGCRVNLNFSRKICDSLKQQTIGEENQYERDVQKLVAIHASARSIIFAVIPAISVIFVGAWSDKTGNRKIFLLVPVIGQILICFNDILNTFFFDQLSLEIFVYSEVFIEAISGGYCVFFLSIYSYIGAITTEEERTFRMGLLLFCQCVGSPIGFGLSGILLKKFGYYFCYTFSACLQVISAFYIILYLKNPKRSNQQIQNANKGCRHSVKLFLNFMNLKETIQVIFKRGPKLRMITILIANAFAYGPCLGEISIAYISTRYRFNWDEVQFSVYMMYYFFIHTIGTVFAITVFSKRLQWHDSILGIISNLSKISASFIFSFAKADYIFYIGPLVDILNGTANIAFRSIASKSVASEDLGKVNSIIGLTENLSPLLFIPLYIKVYTTTMEFFPGAVFLLGAVLTLPPLTVFTWLLYEHKKKQRNQTVEDEVQMKFLE